MGRPICRPEHGPSRKAPRADTQVRPYAMGEVFRTNEIRCGNGPCPNGAGRSPPPTGAPPAVRSNGPMYLGHGFRQPNSETEFGASVIGIGPYGEKGKFPQPPGPAAHSGASTPAVARDGRGSEQGITPKGAINLGQSLSQPAADSSCCGTQNSLLAYAHRILTAATPFCSLLPPLAALANVPLYTREPWGRGMRIAVTSAPNFGT